MRIVDRLRPPREHAAAAEQLDAPPADEAFITGNGVASRCGWIRNYGRPRANREGRADWVFCKTDFLERFFAREAPRRNYVLFSHNSDIAVGPRFARQLDDPWLRAWFATNVALEHPKLHPFPIGLANPHWPHGDTTTLRRLQQDPPPRERLFDVSFAVGTNPAERRRCIAATGLEPLPQRPHDDYLRSLSSSYFALCPRGKGIDTHRTWEALYLGAVPVVTRSRLTHAHPELPFVVLEDWEDFRSIEFSPELYHRIRGDWKPDAIRLDRYLERVDAAV